MYKIVFLTFLPLFLISDITGKIILEAKGSCFNSTIKGSCEVSGVDVTDDKIYFINDKNVKNTSSLFFMDRDFTNRKFIFSKKINKSKKLEDIAIYKNQLLLTTTFDRKNKKYNRLIGYNLKTQKDYIIAKKSLRKQLQKLLDYKYLKIEGLEIVRNRLFLGIRAVGKNYKNFNYTITIVSSDFEEKTNGEIELIGDFKIYKSLKVANLGLSSLKYDNKREILYILTSLEMKGKMEGYIFYIENNQIKMLNDKFHIPIQLSSKAEGITIIDDNHLLVVYDDDKRLKNREHNEFLYTVIRLN
jgi:hypothetical protein